MSEYKMRNIADVVPHMSVNDLRYIGKLIYNENPELLKHRATDGTNVILNRLSSETIDIIWGFIKARSYYKGRD